MSDAHGLSDAERDQLVAEVTPIIAEATHRPGRSGKPLRREPYFWCYLLSGVLLVVTVVGLLFNYQKAQRAIDCFNTTLGTRNVPMSRDNAAERAFANAEMDWIKAVNGVFTAMPGTASQHVAVRQLKAQTSHLMDVSTRLSAVLRADQHLRLSNPLGHC